MSARSLTAVDMLPALGSAIVVIVGGQMAIAGDISVVDFAVFYTYLVMLVPSVRAVGLTLGQTQPAFASLRRVIEALEHPVQPSPTEPPLPATPAGVRMRGVRAETAAGEPILDGVDLDVPAGRHRRGPRDDRVGQVDAARPGQSPPRRHGGGDVEVAGTAVGDVELGSLRHAVGTATDDNFLFSGTLAENIAFARPGGRARGRGGGGAGRAGPRLHRRPAGRLRDGRRRSRRRPVRRPAPAGRAGAGAAVRARGAAARQRHRQPGLADRGRGPGRARHALVTRPRRPGSSSATGRRSCAAPTRS